MDKEFLYSRIMGIIFEYSNVHDGMEFIRKMTRLSRSEYWLVAKAAIDQMKSCHYEDYSNLTVEEIVKYRGSPLYYISSDHFEFYLSQFEDYLDFLLGKPSETNTVVAKQAKIDIAKTKRKYTIKQIALICVYEGWTISRKNCDQEVLKFGFKSGEALFQKFTYFSSLSNRTGPPYPYTHLKSRNKIDLLESVIEMVTENRRQRIKDEIVILKKNCDVDY